MPKARLSALRRASMYKNYAIGVTTAALVVVMLLGAFGILTISPFGNTCCTTSFTGGVDADCVVVVDDTPTDYYVGALAIFGLTIDPWIYNLIKTQGLSSEAEYIAYMDAYYPDTVISTFVMSYITIADARYYASAGYVNMSLVGKTDTVCLPGVFVPVDLEIGVCYDNGTFYDDEYFYMFDQSDPAFLNIDLSDYINMTYVMPDAYIVVCNEAYTFSVQGIDIDTGTGDWEVELEVNGDSFINEGTGGGPF